MNKNLLIVGASVRPLLASAVRAGFDICAFDMFADWDAQQLLNRDSRHGGKVPHGTIQKIDRFEDIVCSDAITTCDAALICGGMENRNDLVCRIAEQMEVLGPSPEQLERIADPIGVFEKLAADGFQVPETKSCRPGPEDNSGWLRKLENSSGGLGVCRAESGVLNHWRRGKAYFQQFIDGDSISALFVSSTDAHGEIQSRLLGVTQQLVGEKQFGADEFCYCGSIGPIQIAANHEVQIHKMGRYVASHYGLKGIWGIDFISNSTGCWPVDINPRITASAELFEALMLAYSSSMGGIVDLQVQSCRQHLDSHASLATTRSVSLNGSRFPWVEGKAVLYNAGSASVQVNESLFSRLRSIVDLRFFETSEPGFSIADVPCPGQTIGKGHPILTLRVRCQREDEVLTMLHRKAEQLCRLLGISKKARGLGR